MNKTNTELFLNFLEIRLNAGDSKAKDDLSTFIIKEIDNDLQQISMLYQTQIARNLNSSSLHKLNSYDIKKTSFSSFNILMDKIISKIKVNFEICSNFLQIKIQKHCDKMSDAELSAIKEILSFNIVHNCDLISFHLNKIRSINELYTVELLIINTILRKIKTNFFAS